MGYMGYNGYGIYGIWDRMDMGYKGYGIRRLKLTFCFAIVKGLNYAKIIVILVSFWGSGASKRR